MDQTKGPDDVHNQPADQPLINAHPELQDPSTKPFTPGPQNDPVAPPTPGQAPSERPPVAAQPGPPSTAVSAPNDSQGHPRPSGPGASDSERDAAAESRRQEAETRRASH